MTKHNAMPPCFPKVSRLGESGNWKGRCERHGWESLYGSEQSARRGAAAHKRSKRRRVVKP